MSISIPFKIFEIKDIQLVMTNLELVISFHTRIITSIKTNLNGSDQLTNEHKHIKSNHAFQHYLKFSTKYLYESIPKYLNNDVR